MDVNWLVSKLKTVEHYVITNPDGTQYQDSRAPTSLNLKAARVIEDLAKRLENARAVEQNLMYQLTKAYEEIDNLQRNNSAK